MVNSKHLERDTREGWTAREVIHAMLCENAWFNERNGYPIRQWRISEIAHMTGFCDGTVRRAIKRLDYAVEKTEHWFGTRGGPVMEWFITLR